MHPILFEYGAFKIYTYGVMMAIAFLAGSYFMLEETKKRGMNYDSMNLTIFFILIGGLVGARAFYVVQSWSYFKDHLNEIVMLQNGGLVWFGGLFGGILAGFLSAQFFKMPKTQTADVLFLYLPLAQAIGRWGCFFNGCCYGINHFPIQIVYSALVFVLFLYLKKLSQTHFGDGVISFSYLAFYSAIRFFLEFARGDQEHFLGVFSIPQFVSIVVFIVAILLVVYKRRARVL